MNRGSKGSVMALVFKSGILKAIRGLGAVAISIAVCGCASERHVSAGQVQHGAALVDRWCSGCHGAGKTNGGKMAPSFSTVANRQGQTESALRHFLDQDHLPMTTFRLWDDEKDDVAAYIYSLRN